MAASFQPHEVRWLALDRSLRRRVARSVRSGTAVGERQEAAVAAGYCTALLTWLSQPRRLRPFRLLVALVLVVELLLTATIPVVPLLAAVAGFGWLRLRTPSLRRRLTAALTVTLDEAEQAGLSPVRVQLPGHAWLTPGHRRRRILIVLGAALAIATWLLIESSVLIGNGR